MVTPPKIFAVGLTLGLVARVSHRRASWRRARGWWPMSTAPSAVQTRSRPRAPRPCPRPARMLVRHEPGLFNMPWVGRLLVSRRHSWQLAGTCKPKVVSHLVRKERVVRRSTRGSAARRGAQDVRRPGCRGVQARSAARPVWRAAGERPRPPNTPRPAAPTAAASRSRPRAASARRPCTPRAPARCPTRRARRACPG